MGIEPTSEAWEKLHYALERPSLLWSAAARRRFAFRILCEDSNLSRFAGVSKSGTHRRNPGTTGNHVRTLGTLVFWAMVVCALRHKSVGISRELGK